MTCRRPGLGHELTVGAHSIRAATLALAELLSATGRSADRSRRSTTASAARRSARSRRRQGRGRRRPRRARGRTAARRRRGARAHRDGGATTSPTSCGSTSCLPRPRCATTSTTRTPSCAARRRSDDRELLAPLHAAHCRRLARHRPGDLDAVDCDARRHARRAARRRPLPRRRRRGAREPGRGGARGDAGRRWVAPVDGRASVRRRTRPCATSRPASPPCRAARRLVAELAARAGGARGALLEVTVGPADGTHVGHRRRARPARTARAARRCDGARGPRHPVGRRVRRSGRRRTRQLRRHVGDRDARSTPRRSRSSSASRERRCATGSSWPCGCRSADATTAPRAKGPVRRRRPGRRAGRPS